MFAKKHYISIICSDKLLEIIKNLKKFLTDSNTKEQFHRNKKTKREKSGSWEIIADIIFFCMNTKGIYLKNINLKSAEILAKPKD